MHLTRRRRMRVLTRLVSGEIRIRDDTVVVEHVAEDKERKSRAESAILPVAPRRWCAPVAPQDRAAAGRGGTQQRQFEVAERLVFAEHGWSPWRLGERILSFFPLLAPPSKSIFSWCSEPPKGAAGFE